jgi:thiol-disulfide isomerase/thioredoxin
MFKRLLIVLLAVLPLVSCSVKQNTIQKEKKLQTDKDGYVEFYEAIKSNHFVIAKFGLDICVGCIEANNILKSLMPEYGEKIYFSKVDLLADREAEKKYNIKMMPTIIFFDKKGKEFYRIEGTVTKKAIKDKIDSICLDY